MKVFFGNALDDMVRELRGQGAAMVRLHVLPRVNGQVLHLPAHVTTLCNNQVYEAVVESRESVADVPAEELPRVAREKAEGWRAEVAERLGGFELRRGVLQE